MKVPDSWPKPHPGKYRIRTVLHWGSGWYLYDSTGKVRKSGDIEACVKELRRLKGALG